MNAIIWKFFSQAIASIPPQLWQPASGILMMNDISDTNLEDIVPFFALSKNDGSLHPQFEPMNARFPSSAGCILDSPELGLLVYNLIYPMHPLD